jgi:TP901 family phage tail tape measure protein
MGKAGWSTSDIMSGMGGVLDAAAASGENLGLVSTVLADSITGFGLSAKDSTRVADLLTEAANAGTIGVGDLGETFKYVAPLAKTCGFSIEDVTTATTALSMSGIKGSQAGTTLRTVISSMVKPTKDVQKAMDDLGIEITNSDGSFKSLDEIVTTMRSSFNGLTEEQKAY